MTVRGPAVIVPLLRAAQASQPADLVNDGRAHVRVDQPAALAGHGDRQLTVQSATLQHVGHAHVLSGSKIP